MKQLLTGMKTALWLGIGATWFPMSSVSRATQDRPPAYVPLGERSLAEMAQAKLHHADGRFVNPFSRIAHGNLLRVLRWKLFSPNRFKDAYDEEPTVRVEVDLPLIREKRGLRITFVKHACILISDADRYLLVDPIFGGLMGFIKDFSPLAFDPRDLPRPDYVLVTHGHYDHLDTDTLSRIGPDADYISPLGYGSILGKLKLPKRTALDWYSRSELAGREITLLPCNHWSMRNPFVGPNTGLWGSYLIRTRSGPTIYVSGDTAYFDGFKQIGAAYDIDLAVFNLGAYEPRWFMAASHMNPAETVNAFQDLGARHLMIVHWGSFRLGDEPVHYPPMDLKRELDRRGLADRLIDIRHGQTVRYG